MDPELYKLIQEAVSDGIATTQIMSGIIALFAAGFGAWIGSYFSKRGEFAAFKDDFDESLSLLRQQTQAVEETKAEVQKLQSAEKLAQELQKTRGVERQELRYKSYGKLWKRLRPLAIYHDKIIDKTVVDNLSLNLTDWYFSEAGGLLLTPQAREFYFALQDLLRTISEFPGDWGVNPSGKSAGSQGQVFKNVLIAYEKRKKASEELSEKPSDVFEYFTDAAFEDWQEKAPAKGKTWREGINAVAENWNELNDEQRFATLQQVGSILRTCLTNDLESRLR